MDYSQYKFTYYPKQPQKARPISSKKKREKLGVFLVTIVLLSLLLSLALIGHFSGRDLVGETVGLIAKKDTLNYYVVCLKGVEYLSDATYSARTVRLGGGAGFIFNENNLYFVSLATYLTENEAKEVVSKNENTTYLSFTFNRREYLNKVTDDGQSKEVLVLLENVIESLIDITQLLEKKELSLLDAEHRVEALRNELLNCKMTLLENNPKNASELLFFLEPLIEALNLVNEGFFLPNIRYGICDFIDNLCGETLA